MKFAVSLAAAAALFATPAMAGDVTVTLTGVKAKGGTIRVSLYDKATFLRALAPFIAEAKGDKAGDATVTFRNVPAGDYAIAALHDADDNEKITSKDGMMAEGTALSRSETLTTMPTFDLAKVAVPASGAAFTVAMSYPEDRTGW